MNNQKGFTLVETLVALSIFLTSVVGMLVITGQGLHDITNSKNKIEATALSQEGIEIIRNVRDTYLLSDNGTSGEGWTNFITYVGSLCQETYCGLNPQFSQLPFPPDLVAFNVPGSLEGLNLFECSGDSSLSAFTEGSNCRLKRDDLNPPSYTAYTNAMFSSGEETPFIRQIQIANVWDNKTSSYNRVHVTSIVKWKEGSTVQSVKSEEYLMNWFVNTTTP